MQDGGVRKGGQDGAQPLAHWEPSPTHHGGAGHGDPFLQRPESLLLRGGSRGPGLCLGQVRGTGSRSQRHMLPGAWTAATGCTLGQARPLGLVRRHGRAHAGLCRGGGAVPPPVWLRGGCAVDVGWLWGSRGQCWGCTRLGRGMKVWRARPREEGWWGCTCVWGGAGQPAAREAALAVPRAVPVVGAAVGAGSGAPVGVLPWADAGFGWRGREARGSAWS